MAEKHVEQKTFSFEFGGVEVEEGEVVPSAFFETFYCGFSRVGCVGCEGWCLQTECEDGAAEVLDLAIGSDGAGLMGWREGGGNAEEMCKERKLVFYYAAVDGVAASLVRLVSTRCLITGVK